MEREIPGARTLRRSGRPRDTSATRRLAGHLQLPGAGHGCGRQPKPLLERASYRRVWDQPARGGVDVDADAAVHGQQHGVTWSVDGVVGGSASSGTITATGLYTPPNSVGTHTVTATTSDQSQSANATVYVTNYPGTFTYHNDNLRTGQNLNETVLTPANVNSALSGSFSPTRWMGWPLPRRSTWPT